jgi:hypothetical protein
MPSYATSATLAPCEWETFETTFLQELRDVGTKAQRLADRVTKAITDVQHAIDRYKHSFWGEIIDAATAHQISNFINLVLTQLKITVWEVNAAIQAVVWIVPKIMAPWTIRSIGRQMGSSFDGKVQRFSDSLDPSQLRSPKSWDSDGGKDWLTQAEKLRTAGSEPTAAAVEKFSKAVTSLGERGVAATEEFAGAVTGGITDIASGLGDLTSIVKAIPRLLKVASVAIQVVAMVYAIVKFAYEIASSSSEFADAAEGAVAADWPKPTSR